MPKHLSNKQRTEREANVLVRSHLARAMDAILVAYSTIEHHGLGQRLETDIVAALSHLDQAERVNRPFTWKDLK